MVITARAGEHTIACKTDVSEHQWDIQCKALHHSLFFRIVEQP